MALYEITETRISYHRGDVRGEGVIQKILPAPDGRWAVITDATPFHPCDDAWPDQPADHGMITVGGEAAPVVDSRVLTLHRETGELVMGSAVTARRGDPDQIFAVAHIVEERPRPARDGQTALLEVDTQRRRWLSAAHTGCHLVAYAFNEATDELWTKDAPRNSRGSRDFDGAALIDTRHHVGGSVDRYRLGKSLRRKGFDHARLLADLDTYVERANATLKSWVASDAPVTLTGPSDSFTAERLWACGITPVATMPCGGTHVSSLGRLASIDIRAAFLPDERELHLTATSEPR